MLDVRRSAFSLSPHRAFSLIEMIGVLAVLAILAAAIAPAILRRVDIAALTKEQSDLDSIAEGLTMQALRAKSIPSEANWSQTAATWVQFPASSIAATPRGYPRVFLIDTNGTFPFPYNQTTSGTSLSPTNARVMILSTIARDLTSAIATGRPDPATFSDIWSAPKGIKPTTLASWSGSGQDLLIERINLGALFHRLILLSRDTNGAGQFTVDGAPGPTIPVNNGVGWWDAYYLDGTVIGLTNTAKATLEATLILKNDLSCVFEQGAWRDQLQTLPPLTSTTNTVGSTFATNLMAFLNSNLAPVAHNSATQLGIADFMYTYMWNYAQWANGSPCFGVGNSGNANQTANYLLMQSSWSDMNSYANWLLGN